MSAIKHDPRVRLFANGQWTDVTYDRTGQGDGVRVEGGIEIFHGQQDESKSPNPGTCGLTFGNKSGDFTPRNPLGQYAGYLNVNTPVCALFDEIVDHFGRTVSNSWGDTDTGETYESLGTSGTAADFNVAGGVGTHTVTTAATYRMSWLNDTTSGAPRRRNVIQKVRLTLPFTDVTVGALEPANLLCRQITTTAYYMCRFVINTDETVSLQINRVGGLGSATLAGPVTVPGITHVAGQGIWIMFGAIDDQLMVTAWVGDDPEDEPQDWLLTVTDDDPFLKFGRYGIRTGAAAGNTNVPYTASYDNWTVWIADFCGDIPGFPQNFTDDNGDAIVPTEAGGITRRLTEGGAPLLSSARRWYEGISANSTPPDWYWPLDDGELTTVGRATRRPAGFDPEDISFIFDFATSIISGNPNSSNEKRFSQAKTAAWLPNGVKLPPDNATFYVGFPSGSADLLGSTWAVDWTWTLGANIETTATLAGNFAPGVTVSGLPFDLHGVTVNSATGNLTIFPGNGVASTVISLSLLAGVNILDGRAHHFRYRVNQTGGVDIHWTLEIDAHVIADEIEGVHPSIVNFFTIQFNNSNAASGAGDVGVSNVALFVTVDPFGDTATSNRLAGFPNENGKHRFGRLADEENIENFVITAVDEEPLMGPQYMDPIMDQFFEIMRTDGGLLIEAPDGRYLDYLQLEELRGIAVGLTLDVSAAQIAPGFEPIDDTQNLKNKIRAIKRDGGDFVYEQTEGRLGTADPKDGGAGVYAAGDVKANPNNEGRLVSIAQREVADGTVDKARYPEITVNLMAPVITSNLDLRRAILDTKVGSRLKLTNMQAQHIYEDADLLVIGRTRRFTNHEHTITWNTIPYHTFDTFHVETAGSILGTDSTYIVDGINSSATTTRIVTEGSALWTTNAGSLPITARFVTPPANVDGEDISVTNVVTTAPGFRSVGTASHGNNATTTPGLPAGQVAGDTFILVTAIRNTAATAAQPTGYSTILAGGHWRVCIKTSVGAGETVPNCTYASGAAGDDTSSFIMAFTNMPFGYVADSIADIVQTNGSAQDIAFPENVYTFNRDNGLELLIAWKQDDYTSIAVPVGYTEIAEYFTTTGNDQGLYAAYRSVPYQDASPSGSLVVTGGAAAVSKAYKAYFVNPQVITFTRGENGAQKSWPALTQTRIAYPKPLG